MSYQHNNLMAIRERYWQEDNARTAEEKQAFIQLLQQQGIFEVASLDDAKYLFFSLPSNIILQGHAFGFNHPEVRILMKQYIQRHKSQLTQRRTLKIRLR